MEKFRHAHESPPSMTIPLIVLGVLAVVGGWIGIPASLKGGDQFFKWLAPIFAYEEFFSKLESRGRGLELLLTIATFLWVLHLGLIANILYSQKLGRMQALAERFAPVYRLISNKFYVDEIYRFLVIRPIALLSEKIFWKFGDQKVIDSLMVEGTAETVGLAGRTLALLQNGMIQTYALLFAVGAIVFVGYFIL